MLFADAASGADSGGYLAYTHNVRIEVPLDQLEDTHVKVVDQCNNASEWACTVLSSDINHSDYPSASVRMRVSPSGVERLISVAAEGGTIHHKSTSVEDLAEPVKDVSDKIGMLRQYLADLESLREQSKNDIQGLIRVTSEIASVTSRLERALGEQAHLREKIDLQILSVHLMVDPNSSFGMPIGRALSEFGEDLSQGIAQAITGFAYVLPWLVILIPLFFLIRRLWRKTK